MKRIAYLSMFSALLLGAACSSDESTNDDPECVDGRCDNSFVGACMITDLAGSTSLECEGAEPNAAGKCHFPSSGRFAKEVCCSFGGVSGVKRHDELANRIINEGDSCPTSFRDVMTSLSASGCKNVETRVVETSAHHLDAAGLTGQAQDDFMLFGGQVPETGGYHTVTTMQCGDRDNAENRIMFLQSKQFEGEPAKRKADGTLENPGVSETSIWERSGLRKTMEVIAWDPTGGPIIDGNATGVYNYYGLEAADENGADCKSFGKCAEPNWSFHGNSAQFLDLNENLEQTGAFFAAPQKRRCAECHTGGGLIMRELNSPWINWEEDFVTPGARGLMAAHGDVLGKDLSSRSGADQEFTVVGDGNELWDKQRILIANSATTMANPNPLLKPLFCSVEINVQTSFSANVSSVGNSFFFDPTLSSKANASLSVRFANSTYRDAVNSGQVIPRLTNGTGATGLDAPFNNVPGFGVVDTAGGFMVPERSGADMEYLGRLEDAGIVDSALVKAVLGVDFTRPIFSPTRCGILAELNLTWSDLGGNVTKSDTVRAAIEAKLNALSTAGTLSAGGQELLANLAEPEKIDERMDTFANACTARVDDDESAMVADIIHVANVTREKAYELPLYQLIPSSMPAGEDFRMGLGPFRQSSGQTENARFGAADCSLETLPKGQ